MQKVILKSYDNQFNGKLMPLDLAKLPFVPKRVFCITDVPRLTKRGMHAHKETLQFLICLQGWIDVAMSDGEEITIVQLGPFEGVFIDKMIFAEQQYMAEGSVLMVLASTEYDADDYIHDLESFKQLKQQA